MPTNPGTRTRRLLSGPGARAEQARGGIATAKQARAGTIDDVSDTWKCPGCDSNIEPSDVRRHAGECPYVDGTGQLISPSTPGADPYRVWEVIHEVHLWAPGLDQGLRGGALIASEFGMLGYAVYDHENDFSPTPGVGIEVMYETVGDHFTRGEDIRPRAFAEAYLRLVMCEPDDIYQLARLFCIEGTAARVGQDARDILLEPVTATLADFASACCHAWLEGGGIDSELLDPNDIYCCPRAV